MDLDEPTPETFFEGPHLPPLPITFVPFAADHIDSNKNDQIISARDDCCRRYLMCWNIRLEFGDAGLFERTCSNWLRIYWSTTRTIGNLTWQGWVLPTPWELIRTPYWLLFALISIVIVLHRPTFDFSLRHCLFWFLLDNCLVRVS